MAGNRIELWGQLATAAELRVTPAGTPVLRMVVRCEAPGDRGLMLTVVSTGENARALAQLGPGDGIRVSGALRSVGKVGIEVMAKSIERVA